MRFSIVIPTQDRPELLAVAARHAMRIVHSDFEVIVSDNSTSDDLKRRNTEAVREYTDAPNFRLVSPPRVLSPPEHFEFALNFAVGDYIAYLTDKMVILPHALSDVDAITRTTKADIVNWAYAQYAVDDSKNPSGSGSLTFELELLNGPPKPYDPIAALRFKASCCVPRDKQSVRDYALGKIVFGCFSKELIDRIQSTSGTVFGGATHDYSAMVQGLSLARTCVMLNKCEILFVAVPQDQSLGSITATVPQFALRYFRSFTEADSILSSLLVPGVYASQHNMVAHDYKKFLPLYGNMHFFNETNWLCAIHSDLIDESKVWHSPAEGAAQLEIFIDHLVHTGRRFPVGLKQVRDRLAATYRKLSTLITSRLNSRIRRKQRDPESRTFVASSLDEAIRYVSTK